MNDDLESHKKSAYLVNFFLGKDLTRLFNRGILNPWNAALVAIPRNSIWLARRFRPLWGEKRRFENAIIAR